MRKGQARGETVERDRACRNHTRQTATSRTGNADPDRVTFPEHKVRRGNPVGPGSPVPSRRMRVRETSGRLSPPDGLPVSHHLPSKVTGTWSTPSPRPSPEGSCLARVQCSQGANERARPLLAPEEAGLPDPWLTARAGWPLFSLDAQSGLLPIPFSVSLHSQTTDWTNPLF